MIILRSKQNLGKQSLKEKTTRTPINDDMTRKSSPTFSVKIGRFSSDERIKFDNRRIRSTRNSPFHQGISNLFFANPKVTFTTFNFETRENKNMKKCQRFHDSVFIEVKADRRFWPVICFRFTLESKLCHRGHK